MRPIGIFFAGLAALLGLARGAGAVQPPATARGFEAGKVYQMGEIDSVNPNNGNLVLQIPLGMSYTAGDRLSYRFTLSYNSSIWDYEDRCGEGFDDPALYRGPEYCFGEAVPARQWNAGVGWLLTLGELTADDYFGPDGGAVGPWSSTLHGEPGQGGGSITYSRDGSYLRATTSQGGDVVVIEDAAGTKRHFHCAVPGGCGASVVPVHRRRYDLVRIEDAFGSALAIEKSESANQRTMTFREIGPDGVDEGVEQRMVFARVAAGSGGEHLRWVVERLELAGPEGRSQTWHFEYYPAGDAQSRLFRDIHHGAPREQTQLQQGSDALTMPMLKRIYLAATPGTADPGEWAFRYADDPAPSPPFGGFRPYPTSRFDGRLARVVTPTKSAIDYQWGTYVFPNRTCGPASGPGTVEQRYVATGVHERQFRKPPAGALSPTALLTADMPADGRPWLYRQDIGAIYTSGAGANECRYRLSSRTFIQDPESNVVEYYFHMGQGGAAAANDPSAGDSARDPVFYGFPFSPEIVDPLVLAEDAERSAAGQPLGTSSGGVFVPSLPFRRYLSSRMLDCPESFVLGSAPIGSAGCTLERETYVRYAESGQGCNIYGDTDCMAGNRRLVAERTVFRDDEDPAKPENSRDRYAWRLTRFLDFDGLGNHRVVEQNGNFAVFNFPSLAGTDLREGDHRVRTTNFNPGIVFDPVQRTLNRLPAHWVLGTYSAMEEAEWGQSLDGGQRTRRDRHLRLFAFDGATGFLRRARSMAGDQQSSRDIVVEYERRLGDGGVELFERTFGGDLADNAPIGDLASFDAADLGTPEYEVRQMVRHGGIERIEYLCPEGLFLLFEESLVDAWTGLALESRDLSGRPTTYDYDALGRLVGLTPAGEARNEYRYPDLASSSLPFELQATSIDEQTGAALRTSFFRYDHRGRQVGSSQNIPEEGLQLRTRSTRRDFRPIGWQERELGLGAEDSEATRYSAFDMFGRAGTVTAPDGSRTQVTYAGERLVQRLVETRREPGIEKRTTEKFDAQGRLVFVSQGALPRAVYHYDSLGNIKEVEIDHQRRFFHYDDRNLLVRSTPPELAGKAVTLAYDSRGNVRERKLAALAAGERSDFDLAYSYDRAERLTSVTQLGPAGGPLKNFEYYGAGAPLYSKGKLQKARRINRVPQPGRTGLTVEMPVEETFEYSTTTGRPAAQELSLRGFSARSGFAFDALGLPSSLSYPLPAGGAGGVPSRTVSMEYREGSLTAVPGFANRIFYHRNGVIDTVRFANGVDQVYAMDEDAMARIGGITFRGNPNAASLDLGPYVYSERGNILSIGSSASYSYDDANRVKRATVDGVSQDYVYDGLGNLKQVGPRLLDVDSASNRLTHVRSGASSLPVGYDVAGNITTLPDIRPLDPAPPAIRFGFDAIGRLHHTEGQGLGRVFLFTAGDERVAILEYDTAAAAQACPGQVRELVSVRGLATEVLRDFEGCSPIEGAVANWSWTKDHIYRGAQLLASVERDAAGGEVKKFLHLDHLGSVRGVTSTSGAVLERIQYLPYGTEINQLPGQRLRFTGHERDDDGTSRPWADFDYMHARHYAPSLGRFLSPDPVGDWDPKAPQSWNLYGYTRGNPVLLADPTGEYGVLKIHEVLAGKFHIAVLLVPTNQARWRNDPRFLTNPKTGNVYITIGAESQWGKLVSGLNRESDANLDTAVEFHALDLQEREDEFIEDLLSRQGNYSANTSDEGRPGGFEAVDYDLFPVAGSDQRSHDGFNSNSFVSGLLRAAGIEPPPVAHNVPGYDKPVPAFYFFDLMR